MKSFFSVVLLFFCLIGVTFQVRWAVLVAGSNGYSNYRHQADICHAYQTLITKGVLPAHIIVFAYDDIAYHTSNPFPGKIFNKPSSGAGFNVYHNCKIDYKGNDVTPTNYINVITGNATAMIGIGTGRVLQSTSADNVFIYFADHGGYGLIAFPNKYLYVNDFQSSLNTMYTKNMYKELVYYLEACESGSMFLNFSSTKRIYGLTASNPTQSSYATYCSSSDTVNGVDLHTCLGDLFSVSFLEDTDAANTWVRTLQQQFNTVKTLTSASVVTQYGATNFTNKNIGQWVGQKLRIQLRIPLLYKFYLWLSVLDARLVKLRTFYRLWQNDINNDCHKEGFYQEARQITQISLVFENITKHLNLTTQECEKQEIHIRDHDCVKNLVETFENQCMNFGEYGLKFVYYIVYICERDQNHESFAQKVDFLMQSCPRRDPAFNEYAIDYFENQLDNSANEVYIDQNAFDEQAIGEDEPVIPLVNQYDGGHRMLTDYMNNLRRRV